MLTVPRGVGSDTRTEAEFGVGDEGGPFVVLEVGAEGVAVHETADWVAVPICSVGVEFASLVAGRNVDVGEVADAGDLDIIWSLDEMDTGECTVRDSTGSTTGLGAPCDFDTFSVSDCGAGAWCRRCPKTEVIDVVDPGCLAHTGLGGRRAAVVGPRLTIFGVCRESRG
jgi:hypothetical protein